jgi:DNA-directed RNA polymerase sigma subunit (sigma70/sigma32)
MNYRDPRNSSGQVKGLARLYYGKFHRSIGASLTLDDLEQEFWLVWHQACERFDPERGFEFAAFLGVSIRNKALALLRDCQRRSPLYARSLDEPVGDADSGSSLADLIPSDDESVETGLIRSQTRERITGQLDERLQKLVRLLEDTPPDLQAEFEALRAKAAYAASRGLSMRTPKELTLVALSELMGVSRCVRHRMIQKMQEVIENE